MGKTVSERGINKYNFCDLYHFIIIFYVPKMKLIMEWSIPPFCSSTLRRNSMARATPLKSSTSKSSSTLAGALNALSGKKAEAVAAAPVKAPKKAKTVVATVVVTPPSASVKRQVQKKAAPEAAPVPEKGQAALTELLTATSKARKAAKADALKAEALKAEAKAEAKKAAKKAAKAASLAVPTTPAPVQGADSHSSFQATMPEATKAKKAKKAKPVVATVVVTPPSASVKRQVQKKAAPAFNDVLTAQYVMKVAEKQGCKSRPGFSEQLLETYISGRCIQFISKVGAPASKDEMKEAVASVSHNLYHPPLYNGLVKNVTPPEKIKAAEKSTSKKKKDKKANKIKEGKDFSAAMPEIPFDTKRTLGGNRYRVAKQGASTLTRATVGATNAALVAKQAAFDIPVDAATSLFNTLTGRHPERVPAAIREKARETQRRVEEAPNFFAALIA